MSDNRVTQGEIDALMDGDLGVKYAMERIGNRVWQLEGYRKLNELTEKGEL